MLLASIRRELTGDGLGARFKICPGGRLRSSSYGAPVSIKAAP
jgi:hypothetical protein